MARQRFSEQLSAKVEALHKQGKTAPQIAEATGRTLPAVYNHLSYLRELGRIERKNSPKNGDVRPDFVRSTAKGKCPWQAWAQATVDDRLNYIKSLAGAALALVIATPALAASERDWQEDICGAMGWRMEVQTRSGAYVDCVSDTTAYEVDWSGKWAESIGQALHYASELDKRPGVIFLCRSEEAVCLKHQLRLISTIGAWFDLDDWDLEFIDAREPSE